MEKKTNCSLSLHQCVFSEKKTYFELAFLAFLVGMYVCLFFRGKRSKVSAPGTSLGALKALADSCSASNWGWMAFVSCFLQKSLEIFPISHQAFGEQSLAVGDENIAHHRSLSSLVFCFDQATEVLLLDEWVRRSPAGSRKRRKKR